MWHSASRLDGGNTSRPAGEHSIFASAGLNNGTRANTGMRFYWAGRCVAAMVFIAYATYLVHELVTSPNPWRFSARGSASGGRVIIVRRGEATHEPGSHELE